MNSFAILNGEKYTYVNKIKNIITNETAVLCKDECGNFCFCSIDEWVNNKLLKSISQIKHKLINTALRNRKSNCSNLYSAVERMYMQRDITIQKPVKADMCLLAVMSG